MLPLIVSKYLEILVTCIRQSDSLFLGFRFFCPE
jgi:hypothetical protein